MSDWELAPSNNESISQGKSSDWEIVPTQDNPYQPQNESFLESVAYAVPRMITDLGQAGYNAAQALPSYYEKAKTEIPGLINSLQNSAGLRGLAKQGFAGINEAINMAAQLPLDISRYGSERLNLTPHAITNALRFITPEDTTESINNLFGQPEKPGEALIRGVTRNALPIAGAAKAAKAMPHLTQRGASKTLKKASQLAKERNIGKMNIDPELIKDASQFLPKTSPIRKTLKEAKNGDYNALFRLQSDLGKNATGYAKSLFSAAERSHGRAGLEVRNKLLDAIHENLQSQGHHDISNLLRAGQNQYRRYAKFKPYRNALALAGLGLAIPHSPITGIAKKVLFRNTQ